jgi:hypothetical protein
VAPPPLELAFPPLVSAGAAAVSLGFDTAVVDNDEPDDSVLSDPAALPVAGAGVAGAELCDDGLEASGAPSLTVQPETANRQRQRPDRVACLIFIIDLAGRRSRGA